MTWLSKIALALIVITALVCLGADFIAPAGYATQFREAPNGPPSRAHWLGTDALGRDRFSRTLYGTRVSLLLAPAAAFLSTLLAGVIGGTAGYLGGYWERFALAVTDLFLSLPWLFLLIAVRALLPLDVGPMTSVTVTFALLGCLGWAASARVLCAGARQVRYAEFILQARASGLHGARLFAVHVLPNLKPVLAAQFWISVPVFILSEANLGVLGLGVAEPMPSWGGLMRELESVWSPASEAWKLVPLLLLVLVVGGLQLLLGREEIPA
jgi:ABC-type dipeptide/oligopeptide/nickel transport system permease subunit